jgi:hypothetical protein
MFSEKNKVQINKKGVSRQKIEYKYIKTNGKYSKNEVPVCRKRNTNT